jgi:uncharacterized protein
MKHVFAAAALFAFLAVPAFSPALAEEAIPAARLAQAKELIQVSGAEALLGSADAMSDMMIEQVQKNVPGIDSEAIETLKKIVHEEYAKSAPQMLEDASRIYARHFSEAEMNDMIAFYKTATGKRLVAETPALMRECAQMSADLSTRIVQRFIVYAQERASKEKSPQ